MRRVKIWLPVAVLVVVATIVLLSSCSTPGVAVGDTAPDFTLLDDSGTPVHLYDELDRHRVVLFFYAEDMTPG